MLGENEGDHGSFFLAFHGVDDGVAVRATRGRAWVWARHGECFGSIAWEHCMPTEAPTLYSAVCGGPIRDATSGKPICSSRPRGITRAVGRGWKGQK